MRFEATSQHYTCDNHEQTESCHALDSPELSYPYACSTFQGKAYRFGVSASLSLPVLVFPQCCHTNASPEPIIRISLGDVFARWGGFVCRGSEAKQTVACHTLKFRIFLIDQPRRMRMGARLGRTLRRVMLDAPVHVRARRRGHFA